MEHEVCIVYYNLVLNGIINSYLFIKDIDFKLDKEFVFEKNLILEGY